MYTGSWWVAYYTRDIAFSRLISYREELDIGLLCSPLPVKTTSSYVHSFWHNTGVWRTDRHTDGQTENAIATARSCKSPPVKIQYAKHHTDLYRSIWSICPRVKWQAPILKTLLITVRRTREKLSELRCCVVQHNCVLSCNSYWWTSPVYLSYKFGFCHVFVFFLSWCRLGLVVTATVWKDLSPDWRMTYRVEGQTSPRFMDSHVIADFIRVCFWPQIGLFRLQLKQKWS